MLFNIANRVMRPVFSPGHLVHAGLVAMALLILASPSLAATPENGASSPGPNSPQGQAANPLNPNATCPQNGQCFADVLSSNPFYAFVNRLYQQNLVTGYACGGAGEPCDQDNRSYYRPVETVTRQQMAKFIDNARRLPGIHIQTDWPGAAIYISNTATVAGASGIYAECRACPGVYGSSTSNAGVHGISSGSIGVAGSSTSSAGVAGYSSSNYGVFGESNSSMGVYGFSNSSVGVYGYSNSDPAGCFFGNVQVLGNLSKGGGSFKIDDPIDPANKYLYHSFVESPDMMDIYNGDVTLDDKGEAVVQMPDWFQALNRDFRYQLTAVGAPAPGLYIAQKIEGNHFKIAGGVPGGEVSWQVTGIRQDPYANAHRIPMEQDKPTGEKGKYLYPTEQGQPASLGVDYQATQKAQQAVEATPGP